MTRPAVLTGKDFRAFMEAMGLNREKCAVALGLSVSQIDNLAAERFPIRRGHALALMALMQHGCDVPDARLVESVKYLIASAKRKKK